MREDRLAFDKAIDSGDTDLGSFLPPPFIVLFFLSKIVSFGEWVVYQVLLHLKARLSLGDFFRLVDDRPAGSALLEIYAKQQDREMLRDFYYQDDRRLEGALLVLDDAYRSLVCPTLSLFLFLLLLESKRDQVFFFC